MRIFFAILRFLGPVLRHMFANVFLAVPFPSKRVPPRRRRRHRCRRRLRLVVVVVIVVVVVVVVVVGLPPWGWMGLEGWGRG